MTVLTDFPERLKSGETVYLGENHDPHTIKSVRWHSNNMLISFEDYSSRETAGELRNCIVTVRAQDRPALQDGEYYHHQIIGLSVYTDENRYLGRVTSILETGANDVYIVELENEVELLIPAIDQVVLDINLISKEMQVRLLPGMIPD